MENFSMAVGEIIGRDVLLYQHKPSERIRLHTYASKIQIGRVISGK